MPLKNSSSQMAGNEESEISKMIIEGAEKTNSRSSSACIYRVSRELRALKRTAYTPHLVSVGPFHSKDKYLKKRSGDIKLSYVKSLFDRIPKSENTDDESDIPKQCLEKMEGLVKEAKKYYAEEVDGAVNKEMLLIDGCFILEFLYRYAEAQQISNTNQFEYKKSDDPIFGSVPTRLTVQDDLLLLENQLPFFVLQSLYNLTLKKLEKPLHDSLPKYVSQIIPKLVPFCNSENSPTASSKNNPKKPGSLCECYCCVILVSDKNKQNNNSAGEDHSKEEHPMHILDFIHKKYRPPPVDHHNSVSHGKYDQEKINTCSKFMNSASDLHYAGVKFEAPAEAPDNIFMVSFKEGMGPFYLFRRARFQIPTLLIDDSTERLLRNLIAFEQCHPRVDYYVTSYAFLMDRLINTAKDVEVLQKAGVLRNYLRANEEASDIFNKLCQEVVLGKRRFSNFTYADTCDRAARYSERWWPEFMAYVRYTYFSKPWTFLAFCIAFIAFGATMGNFLLNLSRNLPNK